MLHERDIGIAVIIMQGDVFPRFARFVNCDRRICIGREVRLIADILFAVFAADEEPTEATTNGFKEVPWIEYVEEGFEAEAAAFVRFVGAVYVEVGG